jgi:L-lactate dehydrogenase complex protein LldF
VGLTGANMLVAETGSNVLVTNEGNADLTYSLPRVHIVIASIEKIVPTLEDASTLLRVLARSATGQDMSVYTTFCSGPKRPSDPDGPDAYHVVLLDNGRTDLLGSEFEEVLRCIRCSACMNHCPVYKAIGGHAYGWVYPGPIGAVLTPGLMGLEETSDLPGASTLCGKCESVCPVRIPLPKLLRSWRTRHFANQSARSPGHLALSAWAWLAKKPRLYHRINGLIVAVLGAAGRRKGSLKWLPLAAGWTSKRDFPAPIGDTFIQQYHKGARGDASGTWVRGDHS